uniref:Uncharacterized protein n=1 Tax=Lepeophtheirus salmonis TaxID=72036 RepID=A0A0K2V6K7_LEPSM
MQILSSPFLSITSNLINLLHRLMQKYKIASLGNGGRGEISCSEEERRRKTS